MSAVRSTDIADEGFLGALDGGAAALGSAEAKPFEAPSTTSRASHDAGRSYRRVTIGIAISDALSVGLAVLLVEMLMGSDHILGRGTDHLLLALVPVCWVGLFMLFGLYAPRHLSPVEEFRRVVGASSFGIVTLVMIGFWSSTHLSRSLVGILWILALVFELLTRRIWRLEVARRRAEGSLALRTLIVGTNDEAQRLTRQLALAGSGYVPVGYVASGSTEVALADTSVVTGINGLPAAVGSGGVECLFIASSALRPDEMVKVMQVARQCGVDVRISANLPEILSSRVSMQSIGESMAISVRPLQLSRAQAVAKRGFDLALAGFGLLVSLPLWVFIAVAIKLTSKGPVFFKQLRVTKGGRSFWMIKFRTMTQDWDPNSLDVDPSSPFFKIKNDPRVTRVGRLLRRTSLDELPQLFNVLTGSMSLVGPRPLPRDQVDAHPELLSHRLEVPAGMTGWWQIRGRSEVSAEAAVRLDVFYIENWSLSLDFFILLKTFGVVFTRAGAL